MTLGEYPTYEDAAKVWQKSPAFLKMTREQRMKSLDILRDKWTVAHAAIADQQGVQAEDLTGKAKAITDKVLDYLAGPTIHGPNGQDVDTNPAGRYLNAGISSQLPNDNKQAAIDAALFGIGPEAVAGKAASNAMYRMAMRVAIPTIAGAAGGATEGDAAGGAERGAAEGVGGEALAGIFRMGKRTIGDADFSRLQSWLENRLGVKIPDVQTFRRMFRGGDILPETEGKYNKIIGKLGNKHTIDVPVDPSTGKPVAQGGLGLRMKMTLGQASKELDDLEKAAWDQRGNIATSHQGRALLDTVHDIEGDIASQLDTKDKKAAQQWYSAREQVRKARVLKQMFSEPGVIEMQGKDPKTGEIIDNGKISFEKLQKLVSDAGPNGYKTDLQQAMGPGEQQSLSKVLHRGAAEGEEDRPARGILSTNAGFSSHGSFFGRLQAPWPARHVGDVPFDLGRGRALSALITLGPYQLGQTVNDMTSIPPMHINKTPAEAASTPVPEDKPAPTAVPAAH